jgi:NADPH:quinone reductase-like Zn-dependent oxidoreductase
MLRAQILQRGRAARALVVAVMSTSTGRERDGSNVGERCDRLAARDRATREQARAMKGLALMDGYGIDHVAFTDVADPKPDREEVVVAVEAAALNHLDLWTVHGTVGMEHEFPHVLGADAAGVVAELGDDVRGLRRGARVLVNPALSCGVCELCRAGEQSMCVNFKMLGEHVQGTFAEAVAVPARNVFPVPEHLSGSEAAALGVTFITAYRMLFTRGRMRPGEWVLITGIGGGLAQALFQLARPVAGRLFVTSSSGAKLRRAAEMGADGGVDYSNEDVGKAVRRLTGRRGVDLVLDSAGGESFESLLRALRKGGRVVSAGATAGPRAEVDVRRIFWNQLEVIGSTMGSDADVSDLLRAVAGSGLKPLIERTWRLADGADALAHLESHGHFGKLVLEVA